MFDLPTTSSSDLRSYRKFRKFLHDNGFMMFQYSVYTKIVLNHSVKNHYMKTVKNNAPKKGLVSVLIVTENQFNNIEFITGEFETEIINTPERNIFL